MKTGEITYEEFKEKIKDLLIANPKGLTWGEIKKRANFPQKVPNNAWVRWMERDIGLIREKESGIITWKVNK